MGQVMITLKQVAVRAGLSLPTVSHVLGGRADSYSPQTRAKVIQAAADLGYRANTAARATRTGRVGSIDLWLSTVEGASRLSSPLITGIHDALIERDMQLTVSRMPHEKLEDDTYLPHVLRQHSAEGVLINYTHNVPERFPALLERHRVPAIWLNIKRDRDCVYPNESSGYQKATRYLLELGHKRVAFLILHKSGHFSETDRAAGYETAMREAGLTPQSDHLGCRIGGDYERNPLLDDRVDRVMGWLSQDERPTAVVCYSVTEVSAVMQAAGRLGLNIPDHLSVIGLFDAPLNAIGIPATTLVSPIQEMGRVGVEKLLLKIRQPSKALPPTVIDLPLVVGRTTGPVSASSSSF